MSQELYIDYLKIQSLMNMRENYMTMKKQEGGFWEDALFIVILLYGSVQNVTNKFCEEN